MEEQSFAAEMELFDKLFNEAHVSISPGQFFNSNTPGWFRICFAQKAEYITTGVRRLKETLIQ
ncbi:MAG: aminotransferase class I/II-fold pyridoxal phosphate-dependent enzyme [Chloroflexi bacterium]|jgi:1-aminocyclopropane-1-carboxylate synthase|nr:aminotransferase class I/II-fold pyridoxal phosphate-dependent enzyme [Chloroflexota bacterium]